MIRIKAISYILKPNIMKKKKKKFLWSHKSQFKCIKYSGINFFIKKAFYCNFKVISVLLNFLKYWSRFFEKTIYCFFNLHIPYYPTIKPKACRMGRGKGLISKQLYRLNYINFLYAFDIFNNPFQKIILYKLKKKKYFLGRFFINNYW